MKQKCVFTLFLSSVLCSFLTITLFTGNNSLSAVCRIWVILVNLHGTSMQPTGGRCCTLWNPPLTSTLREYQPEFTLKVLPHSYPFLQSGVWNSATCLSVPWCLKQQKRLCSVSLAVEFIYLKQQDALSSPLTLLLFLPSRPGSERLVPLETKVAVMEGRCSWYFTVSAYIRRRPRWNHVSLKVWFVVCKCVNMNNLHFVHIPFDMCVCECFTLLPNYTAFYFGVNFIWVYWSWKYSHCLQFPQHDGVLEPTLSKHLRFRDFILDLTGGGYKPVSLWKDWTQVHSLTKHHCEWNISWRTLSMH